MGRRGQYEDQAGGERQRECICMLGTSVQACEAGCPVCRSVFEGGCPGQCSARWRRKQCQHQQDLRDYDPLDQDQSRPEPPGARPKEGCPYWCLDCMTAIRDQLAGLDVAPGLRMMTADGHGTDSMAERVSGSRERPSPSPASDDADEVYKLLLAWAQDYAQEKGLRLQWRSGELADRRTEVVCWLLERFDGLMAYSMAVPFGEDVLHLHAGLKAAAKAGVRTLRKPLRCPACHLLLMTYTDGEKYVECHTPGCGTKMTLAEYEAAVERLAKQLETAGITRDDVHGHAAAT